MAKKIHIFDTEDTVEDQMLNEIKLLKELNHPHIIKYSDVCLENDDLIAILEFC